MLLKTTKLRDAIVLALVMSTTTAFGTNAVFAQSTDDTTQTNEESTELETVVVTGTRIESQSVTASSPVAEIQREEFTFAGATRVDDLINQYPQMNPVFDSFQNNPSLGYPTLDLRGLGPQRTLTLVNGNRLAPGAAIFTDISVIPAALVSRVDILTGGASAVYGSDAVAGVVNFILDTEFEGVSINAGYGGYQHDNDNEYIQARLDARNFDYPEGNSGLDGVSRNIDIAVGSSFADGAGHAMAWLTWRENEALFQGQRDYSACALNAAGTTCGGSATNAAGNFYFLQIDPQVQGGATGRQASLNSNGTFNNVYGAPYNYAPINYFQRPDERHTFGSSLKYEINEHVRPYVELMYANKRDAVQIAESGAFFTPVPGLTCTDPLIRTACADLGLNPALPFTVYVAKRNVEGGPRRSVTENSTYRVVAGAEGDINDSWSYNASFLYGHTANDIQGFNDLLSARIVSAILGCPAGSFAGCIPYNVFVPGGVTSQAAAALAGVSFNKTEGNLSAINAYVTGDLGFGFPSADGENISVVFGVESRKEDFDFNADSNSQAGNFAGAPALLPVSGDTQVLDIYMEGAIPVLSNVGIVESLALDLGYRHSDYERSGGENTYKFGMTADFGDYRVRGGYNRAIRAPNVNELFPPIAGALFGGQDQCAGATPVFTLAQCQNSGVTAAQYGNIAANPAGQYNQLTGGNSALVPETADTWTFGFVAQPIEDLSLNIDYYQIEIEDRIGGIGATSILEACGRSGLLCNLIRRNPATGDLWRGNNLATSGFVTNVTDNFGEQTFRGVDLGAAYGWEWLGGRWSTSLQGTYMLEQETVPVPGNDSTTFDCAGQINTACQAHEWRHVASLRFARDWYTLNLRWRYFSELDYVSQFTGAPLATDRLLCSPSTNSACLGDGGVDAFNYLDLSAAFVIGQIGELTVGVNNLADKEPPLVGNTVALNANAPGGYDQVGRQFFASFNFTF